MSKLKTIDLRLTPLSDPTVNRILAVCVHLKRLDLSFTHILHPTPTLGKMPLEKLSLTSTRIGSTDLLTIVTHLPNLKSLSIGALGGVQGSSVATPNFSHMTLTDITLRQLTDNLMLCKQLEHVSLVGNTRLGSASSGKDSAIADFLRRIGRRCIVRIKDDQNKLAMLNPNPPIET